MIIKISPLAISPSSSGIVENKEKKAVAKTTPHFFPTSFSANFQTRTTFTRFQTISMNRNHITFPATMAMR